MATVLVSWPGFISRATTPSTGRTSFAPAWRSTFRASSKASGSTRLEPIWIPRAAKKVLAMAPQTISESTRGSRCLSTPALVETLAPPTIATRGRRGSSSALCSACSSASIRSPA